MLVLSLAGAVGCGGPSSAAARGAAPAPAAAVQVVRLQREPLPRSVTVSGRLAAEEQVTLSFKVTGRVEELRVDLGSTIRKGELIARLTPTDFELRLRQADAALQQARARLGLDPNGDSEAVDPEQTALVRQARAALTEARRQRERVATFVERSEERRVGKEGR